MADQKDKTKKLDIQKRVVGRLAKEKLYYKKEVQTEKDRLERIKSEGGDEHQIKKQGEVIEESQRMIPDTQRKLKKAIDDLQVLLNDCGDMAEMEEYKNAQKQLEDGTAVAEAE